MPNFKYVWLPQNNPFYTGVSSGLYRVPNSFIDTPETIYDQPEPYAAQWSTITNDSVYEYNKNPVASYGPFFTYNVEGLLPEETWQLVDEGIPSDEDNSYVSTININKTVTEVDGSGVWQTGEWNAYDEAKAALNIWCPDWGHIYWYAEQGTNSEGHIYYVQPYIQSFSDFKVTVEAREDNDKGWYHQIRDVAVYKSNGELLGYSEASGELSLTYEAFEFPITLTMTESGAYDYFLSSTSRSVLIKVGYLHTKDSGDTPDNCAISAVKFSMNANIFELQYRNFSGVWVDESGDIPRTNSQSTTFFGLLIGDK